MNTNPVSSFDDKEYLYFINEIKDRIISTQIKASIKVNVELNNLYWNIGKMIVDKQEKSKWGDGLIKQIELDLKLSMPNLKGFSRTNLLYTRKFYLFYKDCKDIELVQQLVGQLPWGHNIKILDKIKDVEIAKIYLKLAIEHNWSRIILDHQIDFKSHLNYNKNNNFQITLPEPNSDLHKYLLKDEYNFDFLTILPIYKEKELENELVNNITKFMLELGKGFAYVGRQYKVQVGGQEYYFDLLFYHLKLRRYIVIELKVGELEASHVGQLGFYVSVVDHELKNDNDGSTIGLLLVSKQNKTTAQIMVDSYKSPIGIAEYKLSKELDYDIDSNLPTINELAILNNMIATTKLVNDLKLNEEEVKKIDKK
jgi:predicted nuclease of restriction endonuclease-like (RecB) superfamily